MQPSTYDVVQIRGDSSKTVSNEAFLLYFRVQHLNLHKNWLVAKSEILYISVIYGHFTWRTADSSAMSRLLLEGLL